MNELSAIPNPFRDTVASDAWRDAIVDIPSINERPFRVLLQAAAQVAATPGNAAVLVQGPAGSGKTHLLGRLREALVGQGPDPVSRSLDSVFVYVRLDANPEMLWQHLRRRLAEDLLRKHAGLSQLQRQVAHEIAQHEEGSPTDWMILIGKLGRAEDETFDSLLDDLEERTRLGRDLRVVLGHLMHGRQRSDARAWLRGDFLPARALERLGLDPEAEAHLHAEESAQDVVLGLCRLASPTLPLVLCFDQLESLQRTPDDHRALFLFGRLAADTYDATAHVLMVTCIQSAFRADLTRDVRQADLDRFAPRDATLSTIARHQAEELILRRMDATPMLRELRRTRALEPLWPLTSEDLDSAFAERDPTVRELLAHSADTYDEFRDVAVRRKPLELLLQEDFEARRQSALEDDDTRNDDHLAHGLALVCGLPASAWTVSGDEPPRDVAFSLLAKGERIDVVLFNQPTMRTAHHTLSRLRKRSETSARLILLREAHRPISPKATRTREHLEALYQGGTRLVSPTSETLAAVEATRQMISLARAGDYSLEGRAVKEATVTAWLNLNLASALQDLKELLVHLTETDRPPSEIELRLEALKELVAEHRVVAAGEAARHLGESEEQVREVVRDHPAVFGWLEGPPAVVFAVRHGGPARLDYEVDT